jgi:hypothetical protein
VSRQTVRNALLDYGIAAPQTNPFISGSTELSEDSATVTASETGNVAEASAEDMLLNPDLLIPPTSLPDISGLTGAAEQAPVSFTGPLSSLTNSELDDLVLCLCEHDCRAGITMLEGMLLCLGHHVPCEHIHQSLVRIDPVQHVFEESASGTMYTQCLDQMLCGTMMNSMVRDRNSAELLVIHANLLLRPYLLGNCHPWLY